MRRLDYCAKKVTVQPCGYVPRRLRLMAVMSWSSSIGFSVARLRWLEWYGVVPMTQSMRSWIGTDWPANWWSSASRRGLVSGVSPKRTSWPGEAIAERVVAARVDLPHDLFHLVQAGERSGGEHQVVTEDALPVAHGEGLDVVEARDLAELSFEQTDQELTPGGRARRGASLKSSHPNSASKWSSTLPAVANRWALLKSK